MKKLKTWLPLALLTVLLLAGSILYAQEKEEAKKDVSTETSEQKKEMTVQEIVETANHTAYYQGMDGRSRVHMLITDSRGREREREFSILRRDNSEKDKEQKYYVYFHDPADVRKMVFMVWKHIGSDDDRWLYLPALDLVKRIAASDKRTSFVGSDFYYEDVSGRSIDLDEHSLASEDEKHYIIKNVPKNPDNVEFSSYKVWIDKKTFMPMKGEYLDKNGKKYRVMEVLEMDEINGYPTVTKSRMSDIDGGSNTVMTFKEVEYDLGLPENVFTERYLRRAPRRWLRN